MHVLMLAVSMGLDEILLRALNLAGTNLALDVLMLLLTTAGASYVIVLFAVPVWLRGHREATLDLLVLIVIAILVTEAIKFAVGRPRPCETLPNLRYIEGFSCAEEFDPAFPSGHASRAFALAAFLGIRFRWQAGVPLGVFAGLVGLSRIYLGVHWPSDVLGGALLGIGLAVLLEIVSRRSVAYARIRRRIVEAIPHVPRRTA